VGFDFLYNFEKFLILRRIERDMIKNVYRSSCKVPVIILKFKWNFNFLYRFSKNTQILKLIKIRPMAWAGTAQSIQRLVTGWTVRWRRDFPHTFRPALGPTQPPIQWIPGLTWGCKAPPRGRGVDHLDHLAPSLKNRWFYTDLHCFKILHFSTCKKSPTVLNTHSFKRV
jgi:hypothetical protein